jgi:sortase A
VAGHRALGLFWDLDKIKPGDEIVVESRKGTFTYVVTRNFITAPDSWPEVSATPPGFRAGNKVLTLTTCNPKTDNYQRLVIHAVIKT